MTRKLLPLRPAAVVMLTAAALIIGYYVWPSPYRYDQVTLAFGGAHTFPVRIHRLTGEAEILAPNWYLSNFPAASLKWWGAEERIEGAAFAELKRAAERQVSVLPSGDLTGTLINQTDWIVSRIRWSITSHQRGTPVSGLHDDEIRIGPHSSALVGLKVGDYQEGRLVELVEAWGFRPQ